MVEQEPREPLSPIGSGELSGATETPGVVESATATDPAVRAGEAAAAAAVAAGDSGPADVPLTDLTAAAFFDVDNTMMVGASIFHFARGLAARKFFTTADLIGFAWQQLKFRIGGRETKYSTTTGRDTALSFVAGRPVAEITALGEEIYDELMADRIWAGTRALAQMHLDAGQRVWLVTATPVELALIIARRLGLTGALGTVAESVDGHFTDQPAYSDSVNDVPMLSAAGTAVAVNPDSELRDIAKERGWQVRDFRTGRRAAKIGVPSVLGAGAIAVAAGLAARKR